MFRFLLIIASICSFANDFNWEIYKYQTLRDMEQIPGMCTKEIAETLMDFILQHKPSLCVEIGALGGATTYPIASALRYVQQGIVFAIDCWENEAFIEGLDPTNPFVSWWKSLNLDMAKIHENFVRFFHAHLLLDYCKPLLFRSEHAVHIFQDESIDFLYIDGSLSNQGSLKDVELYFPKVKKGGYIWMNRADLETKSDSLAFLFMNCCWLKKDSLGISCVVFQK